MLNNENETTLHFPRTFYNNAKFFQYEKAKQIRKRHSFLNYFHQIYLNEVYQLNLILHYY